MSSSVVRIVMLAAAFALASPPALRADEIRQVTSGQVAWDGSSRGSFVVAGDGFSLGAALGLGRTPNIDFPAKPGQVLQLQGRWVGLDILGQDDAPRTVDGTTYDRLYLGGVIALTTEPIVIPAVGSHGSLVTVTTPFTLQPDAQIAGFSQPELNARAGDQLFKFGLSGGGIATIAIRSNHGLAEYQDGTFVFSPNPSPTPEPASAFLLGAGLGAAALARKRQTTRRHTNRRE